MANNEFKVKLGGNINVAPLFVNTTYYSGRELVGWNYYLKSQAGLRGVSKSQELQVTRCGLRVAGDVGENLKVLSGEGLDKKLFEKVLKALGEEREGRSKE